MATNPTDQDGGGTKHVNLAELFQFRKNRLKLEEELSNTDRTPANDAKMAHGHVPRDFFRPASPTSTVGSKKDPDEESKPTDDPKSPSP